MNDKSKLALAFALGAAAGAALAYFLTSESGEKTIEEIKEKAAKLKTEVGEHLDKGKQIVNDLADSAERIINELNKTA
jgi:gas vesicle protein